MEYGSKDNPFDLVVIGGGVNGCGIARDAAGRGYKLLLVEKGDIASGTSQASSKLFHGGLRYLQYYEFGLVRKALVEREVLLKASPHISWPLRFIIPFAKDEDNRFQSKIVRFIKGLAYILPSKSGINPKWLLRLGLFFYDHLGGRKILPATSALAEGDEELSALKSQFSSALEYSDCWVDDARLVVLTAVDARNRGANILTRTMVERAQEQRDLWRLRLSGNVNSEVFAKGIVNATGAWVENVNSDISHIKTKEKIRLVRGSHIVTKRLFDHEKAYFLQGSDGRIVFILPFVEDFSLIGTTEVIHREPLDSPLCSEKEKNYLIAFVNQYLKTSIEQSDVIHSFAGVRPLYDDGSKGQSEATRDYKLVFKNVGAPYLTVFGGKITTYRRLAEKVLDEFATHFPDKNRSWTEGAPLPGGDFALSDLDGLRQKVQSQFNFIEENIVRRLVNNYGTLVFTIFDGVQSKNGLGQYFGHGLYELEVRYLLKNEFAFSVEDILWRRTKLGLYFDEEQCAALARWLDKKRPS